MVERQVISQGIELTHTGLFSTKEIQTHLRKIVEGHGYKMVHHNNDIQVDPKNKTHIVTFRFTKKTSHYDTSLFNTIMVFSHLTKTRAIRNGHETTCNKGKVSVSFEGVSESHKEGFIGYTPIRYFFTYMRSKFITKAYDKVPGEGLDADIKAVFDELFLYIKHTEWKEVQTKEETEGENDS